MGNTSTPQGTILSQCLFNIHISDFCFNYGTCHPQKYPTVAIRRKGLNRLFLFRRLRSFWCVKQTTTNVLPVCDSECTIVCSYVLRMMYQGWEDQQTKQAGEEGQLCCWTKKLDSLEAVVEWRIWDKSRTIVGNSSYLRWGAPSATSSSPPTARQSELCAPMCIHPLGCTAALKTPSQCLFSSYPLFPQFGDPMEVPTGNDWIRRMD